MEKFKFRARPEVFVPVEVLEKHGETVEIEEEERDSLESPSVYWKGDERDCGYWYSVSELISGSSNGYPSETITKSEIKYQKEFREIIESNLEPLEQIERVTELVENHKDNPMIRENLLNDPAAKYYTGLLQNIKGVGEKKANTLFNFGFWSPKLLAETSEEELKGIPGIGDRTAEKIIDGAKEVKQKVHQTSEVHV